MDAPPPTLDHRWRCWLRRRRLATWLELPEARRTSLAADCAACVACRAELDAMRGIEDALRAARRDYRTLRYDGPRPAWHGAAVPGSTRSGPTGGRRPLWTAVAAVVTGVVALGLFLTIDRGVTRNSSTDGPRPAPDVPAFGESVDPNGGLLAIERPGPSGKGGPNGREEPGTVSPDAPGPVEPVAPTGGGETLAPLPRLSTVSTPLPRSVHATPKLSAQITASGFAALRQRAASAPRLRLPRKPSGLVLRTPSRPKPPTPGPSHGDDD